MCVFVCPTLFRVVQVFMFDVASSLSSSLLFLRLLLIYGWFLLHGYNKYHLTSTDL